MHFTIDVLQNKINYLINYIRPFGQGQENTTTKDSQDKWVKNLSENLGEPEKDVLAKGLNFAIVKP